MERGIGARWTHGRGDGRHGRGRSWPWILSGLKTVFETGERMEAKRPSSCKASLTGSPYGR